MVAKDWSTQESRNKVCNANLLSTCPCLVLFCLTALSNSDQVSPSQSALSETSYLGSGLLFEPCWPG